MARRHQITPNEHVSAPGEKPFSPAELRRLQLLRERYGRGLDLFSEAELARLRFLRWLVQSGRLVA